MNCLNYPQDTIERFWVKVNIPTDYENECWEWQAGKDKDGYGRFSITHSKPYRSHRFSYEYYFGAIPDKMLVCHTCDNPSCVNPHHFFIGTNADNLQDMSNKGRSTFGEKDGNSVLTNAAVTDILEGVISNKYRTVNDIMSIYNVSRPTIHRIFNKESWRNITCNYSDLESLHNKINNVGGSKLTEHDVKHIRELYIQTGNTNNIASIYKVDRKTIYNIVNYRTWKK